MKLLKNIAYIGCGTIAAGLIFVVIALRIPNSCSGGFLRERVRTSVGVEACSRMALLKTCVALDCKSLFLATGTNHSYNICGYELSSSSLEQGKQHVSEIFVHQAYAFPLNRQTPFIIDYGAQEGFAAAYFKLRFPKARFSFIEGNAICLPILSKNLKALGLVSEPVYTGESVLADVVKEPVDILRMNYSAESLGALQALEAAQKIKLVQNIIVRIVYSAQKCEGLGELFSFLDRNGYRIQMRSFTGLDVRFLNEKAQVDKELGLVVYAYSNE